MLPRRAYWAFLPEIRHLMAKHLLLLLEIPMADELVSTSISTMKPQKGMKRMPSWQCPFTGTVGSKFLPASDTICEVLSNCAWYRATHQVFSRDAVNSRPTVRRVFAFSSAERLEKAMERGRMLSHYSGRFRFFACFNSSHSMRSAECFHPKSNSCRILHIASEAPTRTIATRSRNASVVLQPWMSVTPAHSMHMFGFSNRKDLLWQRQSPLE